MTWASEELAHALNMTPLVERLMNDVRAQLPDGTHFGIFVLVPSLAKDTEGRIIAMTTDRTVVGSAVAQWIVSGANPLGVDQKRS